jgi:hypothetical protein
MVVELVVHVPPQSTAGNLVLYFEELSFVVTGI